MPEGCRRRCPNVINIFRARRMEKDSLPYSFIPRGSYYSRPAPIFLLMHPPLRGRRRFSICISPPFSPPHLFPPPHPLTSTIAIILSLSSFRKGPRLNSQRLHREESVNATGKREWENVELPRAHTSRDSPRAFLLAETPISSHLHGQT